MTGVPSRLRWALTVLSPGPHEQLLEIGCGSGVAAALVSEHLTTGRLLAIDRSATAIERATRRNQEHLAAGRLELRRCDLSALDLPPGGLDRAFAVDVNLFWTTSAEAELSILRDALRPGGRVHLLYGAGPGDRQRVPRTVAAALDLAGFEDLEVVDAPASFGVSAHRP